MRKILTSDFSHEFPVEHHGRFTPTEALLCIGAACPIAFGLDRSRKLALRIAKDSRTSEALSEGITALRRVAKGESATFSPAKVRETTEAGVHAIDAFIEGHLR